MAKSLGGFMFIKDNFRFDYCGMQAVESMLDFCDRVSVAYVESSDDTLLALKEIQKDTKKLIITEYGLDEWNAHHGKEKLAIFQNYAIEKLDTDYQFLCQGDEILHESCYQTVREAMKTDQTGFLIKRLQLWGDPFHQLNVPHNRLPCSTEVIRLTKRGYPTIGDGESIDAQAVDWFLNSIVLFHCGYVRKREIHPAKIREMQGNIFQCGVDSKLDGMEVFDSTKWFTDKDLIPIQMPLPKIINKWAMERI